MGSYDLKELIGQEIQERVINPTYIKGRVRKIKWTVIEAYPHFVKAMRITDDGKEIYNTFNIGTLVTMGVIRINGVRYTE